MESLETIARGGVSMLTIKNGGQPVKPGHAFSLYAKPEDDWYQAASMVSTTDVELRGVVPLEARWQQRGLLGESTKQATFNGIPFRGKSADCFLLVPGDMLQMPKKGVGGSLSIAPLGSSGQALALPVSPAVVAADEEAEQFPLVTVIPVSANISSSWLTEQASHTPAEIEDCLAVRASGDPRNLTYLHYPIEKLGITATEDGWELNSFDGDRDVWHGSPVLSASDGKLIGVLLIGKRKTTIVKFNAELLDPSLH